MLFVACAAKICGIIGLVIITRAIYIRKQKRQDEMFAVGGIMLLVYSLYLHDLIFIVLQTVFIGSAFYELYSLKFLKNK